jgi:hypothetical protein
MMIPREITTDKWLFALGRAGHLPIVPSSDLWLADTWTGYEMRADLLLAIDRKQDMPEQQQ